MKSVALELPVADLRAEALDSRVSRLVARVQRALHSADAPMELSDTERLVQHAQALRASFLGRRS
jgi:hypothetical protein